MKFAIALAFSVLATVGMAATDAKPAGETAKAGGPQIEFRSENDIGLYERVHFATHTADFDKTREFYRMIGFTEGLSGFPLTNTHQMARALGMFDLCQYELAKGAVIYNPDSINNVRIDFLQFEKPFNDEPPYELPNHLGLAYAALLTTDLAADFQYLESQGVEFLSKPYGVPGNRFVFFRDPEGVLYKLMETAPPHGDPGKDIHINAMPYIGINVSDLEKSLAFYEKLGYTQVRRIPEYTSTLEEAEAYGLDQRFRIKGAEIALDRGDHNVLRLTQWIEPFNDDPPYPPPINRIGINRLALNVPDLERAVRILKRQDVEFLSEIAPCCSGTGGDDFGIVHAIDPDGAFIELLGSIAPRPLQPQPEECPPLEIKKPSNYTEDFQVPSNN